MQKNQDLEEFLSKRAEIRSELSQGNVVEFMYNCFPNSYRIMITPPPIKIGKMHFGGTSLGHILGVYGYKYYTFRIEEKSHVYLAEKLGLSKPDAINIADMWCKLWEA